MILILITYGIFILCVFAAIGLIMATRKLLIPDNPHHHADYNDSEIRMYLAKRHYKDGIYVKFIKHIKGLLGDFEINPGEIVWLRRFVSGDPSGIDTYIVGDKPRNTAKWLEQSFAYIEHNCDSSLAIIEKGGEEYIIRLPMGYSDDELWITPSKNEFIESLFCEA